MTIAITRQVGPRFAECEITHIEREPIDLQLARRQHKAYTKALTSLGCQIIELPAEADLPDSVFVEDTAVILPEAAVITRPGADSRKPEIESIVRVLTSYRPLLHITEPSTMDGGDILILDKQVYVGMSSRSNTQAIRQIQELLDDQGYVVTGVDLHGCLHLKSAVTRVDGHTLLINKNWVDGNLFHAYEQIEVDAAEPHAANCLPVGNSIIFPAAFPKTRKRLEEKGFKVTSVDVSEIAKAEGAVTCCSLIIDD